MNTSNASTKIVVGVDGSEQSIAALRFAHKLAPALGATIQAVSTWDYPPEYAGYVPMGSDNFDEVTRKRLETAVSEAFGADVPEGLEKLVVFSHPSKGLVKASEGALMLVLGKARARQLPRAADGISERGLRSARKMPGTRCGGNHHRTVPRTLMNAPRHRNARAEQKPADISHLS